MHACNHLPRLSTVRTHCLSSTVSFLKSATADSRLRHQTVRTLWLRSWRLANVTVKEASLCPTAQSLTLSKNCPSNHFRSMLTLKRSLSKFSIRTVCTISRHRMPMNILIHRPYPTVQTLSPWPQLHWWATSPARSLQRLLMNFAL